MNPARDRNMQIRRDPYSIESTRLDPRNRGFSRVDRGDPPISERLGINKYGVKWKVIAFVGLSRLISQAVSNISSAKQLQNCILETRI